MLKVNHYQQLTKVLPTKLTIRPIYYIYYIYYIYHIHPRQQKKRQNSEESCPFVISYAKLLVSSVWLNVDVFTAFFTCCEDYYTIN